jgi:putative ABC transport system permease protein
MTDLISQNEFWETFGRILLSGTLLFLILLLSSWQRLRMTKTIVLGYVRGLIQIILLAVILVLVFNLKNLVVIYLYIFGMVLFSAFTARQRYKYMDTFRIEIIALSVGGLSIMGVVTILGIVKPTGEYLIPMGGMVISNAMVWTTMTSERLTSDFIANMDLIEASLSLGASPKHSIQIFLQDALKTPFNPSINRVAILGIVSIPGLLAGMIIGGENPIVAAVYQVIIFLMIQSAGLISVIIVTDLLIKEFFNSVDQINYAFFTLKK